MAGRFITLEGGEGAGKSTQVKRLCTFLESKGVTCQATREPGGSAGAEEIRELLVHGDAERWDAQSECLLHFAARRDHLRKTVWPALDAGTWVVSDRFADSTMAYQGYGHGLGNAFVETLYDLTVGDFHPHLTVILDLPVEVGLGRAMSRRDGAQRYESMDRQFHERLREGFLEIAKRHPQRCVLISAEQSEEKVAAEIAELVEKRLLS